MRPLPDPKPTTFTTDQLADRWQVSKITIKRRLRDGDLRALRIGRAVRVPADEVARYEERCLA